MIKKMLDNFAEQVEFALSLGENAKFSNFDKILVCGMGGSGIAGYVLRDIVEMPVVINQGFKIPKWVDNNTLVFVESYSGNTMETLEMYRQAVKKTSKIVAITSGGKLSKADNTIMIPGGSLPKNAFHYLFFPMINVLKNSGCLHFSSKEVMNAIKIVDKELAETLAKNMHGKTPVIYASNEYYGTAIRWKQNFNETSKQLAVANAYPEFFHNEIEGDFSKFHTIILEDESEKRLEYFKKIVKCDVVKLKGGSKLAKIVYGIHTGDYVAYNLALLNKVDPDSEYRIDKLKELF